MWCLGGGSDGNDVGCSGDAIVMTIMVGVGTVMQKVTWIRWDDVMVVCSRLGAISVRACA